MRLLLEALLLLVLVLSALKIGIELLNLCLEVVYGITERHNIILALLCAAIAIPSNSLKAHYVVTRLIELLKFGSLPAGKHAAVFVAENLVLFQLLSTTLYNYLRLC